jgi:hypothetical protein
MVVVAINNTLPDYEAGRIKPFGGRRRVVNPPSSNKIITDPIRPAKRIE